MTADHSILIRESLCYTAPPAPPNWAAGSLHSLQYGSALIRWHEQFNERIVLNALSALSLSPFTRESVQQYKKVEQQTARRIDYRWRIATFILLPLLIVVPLSFALFFAIIPEVASLFTPLSCAIFLAVAGGMVGLWWGSAEYEWRSCDISRWNSHIPDYLLQSAITLQAQAGCHFRIESLVSKSDRTIKWPSLFVINLHSVCIYLDIFDTEKRAFMPTESIPCRFLYMYRPQLEEAQAVAMAAAANETDRLAGGQPRRRCIILATGEHDSE